MSSKRMIVVHFNPPLERKDFEAVLPKVQEMFPDWEWCGNTGTPKIRDRERILTGAMKNQNSSGYGAPIYTEQIGALLHYGRFGHYGEADCLAYTSGWSQEDTDSYIRQGYKVNVIDGWAIVRHGHLDIEDVFSSLSETTLRRIIRESIDEFDWVEEIPTYDLEGFYMTKPNKSVIGLTGNLIFIEKKEGEKSSYLGEQFLVRMHAISLRDDMMSGHIFPTEQDFIEYAKETANNIIKHDLTTINSWDFNQASERTLLDLVSQRYFIRLF